MPFLCCCGANSNNEDAVATSSSGSARRTVNVKGTESAEERKERELAESVYHDARQSVTASMMMSMKYPPATSSITLRKFSLDTMPQELLSQERSGSYRRQEKPPPQHSSVVVRQELQHQPENNNNNNNIQSQITQLGYPGYLTQAELEACLEFRKLLKEKKENGEPGYYDMVRVYDGVEHEAFALCRFMRARKFVVTGILGLMAGNFEAWKAGHCKNFYPNLEEVMRCPISVLKTQLPILQHGIAKNGSMVIYFQVGGVSLEALDCLSDLENLVPYFWNLFTHGFMESASKAQTENPDLTILFEVTMIIDLKGINRSLFSAKVVEVLQDVIKVFNCFPEVLSKLIFTNAPYFFSAIWMIFKTFLDARTVQKVSIFASPGKGKACMAEHVDQSVLISDYGGKGPSYAKVLHDRSIEKDKDIQRQIVERFFLDPNGKQTYSFDMTPNETATIVVLTRSTSGAECTAITSKGGIAEVDITPDDEGSSGQPYAKEIASELNGPGRFAVTVKSNIAKKEYFVVVVKVYCN
jgi:hypothetical protein